jgi:hypothetical protein
MRELLTRIASSSAAAASTAQSPQHRAVLPLFPPGRLQLGQAGREPDTSGGALPQLQYQGEFIPLTWINFSLHLLLTYPRVWESLVSLLQRGLVMAKLIASCVNTKNNGKWLFASSVNTWKQKVCSALDFPVFHLARAAAEKTVHTQDQTYKNYVKIEATHFCHSCNSSLLQYLLLLKGSSMT